MAEATIFNVFAFEPYGGGQGARLSVTTVTSSAAIPGLMGGQQGDASRVLVSNGGSVSAFVAIGGPLVQAGTGSLEILPGTQVLLKPQFIGSAAMFIAAVTESGSTSVNVCAGSGM